MTRDTFGTRKGKGVDGHLPNPYLGGMAHRRDPDVDQGPWQIWRTKQGLDAIYSDEQTGYHVALSLNQQPRWTGPWQVISLRFEPGETGEPITAAGVRDFKFGAVVTATIGMWFDFTDPDDWDDGGLSLLPSGRDRQRIETQSTMLAAVDLYRRALARGSRTPTKDAALALHRSPSYIAKLLSQARDQNVLGPAPKGKAGEE